MARFTKQLLGQGNIPKTKGNAVSNLLGSADNLDVEDTDTTEEGDIEDIRSRLGGFRPISDVSPGEALSRTGAILAGKVDPEYAASKARIASAIQAANLQERLRRNEELGQQNATTALQSLLNDTDDDATRNALGRLAISSNPRLTNAFKGIDINTLEFGKQGEVTFERDITEEELKQSTNPFIQSFGSPGRARITAITRRGQITGLKKIDRIQEEEITTAERSHLRAMFGGNKRFSDLVPEEREKFSKSFKIFSELGGNVAGYLIAQGTFNPTPQQIKDAKDLFKEGDEGGEKSLNKQLERRALGFTGGNVTQARYLLTLSRLKRDELDDRLAQDFAGNQQQAEKWLNLVQRFNGAPVATQVATPNQGTTGDAAVDTAITNLNNDFPNDSQFIASELNKLGAKDPKVLLPKINELRTTLNQRKGKRTRYNPQTGKVEQVK